MAKTFAQLTQEIEALKTKAEAVRKHEMAGVVARIKEAVTAYGLTAADLGFGANASGRRISSTKQAASKAPIKKAAAQKTKSAIKYRDDAGHSWTGIGPRPGWLKAAQAAGQPLEALTVGAAGTEAEPVASPRASVKAAKPTSKSKKPVSVVKYRDGAGHAWSGRGPKPGWVKDAIAGGKTLQELLA